MKAPVCLSHCWACRAPTLPLQVPQLQPAQGTLTKVDMATAGALRQNKAMPLLCNPAAISPWHVDQRWTWPQQALSNKTKGDSPKLQCIPCAGQLALNALTRSLMSLSSFLSHSLSSRMAWFSRTRAAPATAAAGATTPTGAVLHEQLVLSPELQSRRAVHWQAGQRHMILTCNHARLSKVHSVLTEVALRH